MQSLGINSESIDYEVALENLGQRLQPFIMALQHEREKAQPSAALIAYCEAQMAAMNRKLRPGVETVFLLPDASLQCISSTLVREISKLGGDVTGMVSAGIASALKAAHAASK